MSLLFASFGPHSVMSLQFASFTLLGPHSDVAFLLQSKVVSLEVAHSHCSYASTFRITSSYFARYHYATLRHSLSTCSLLRHKDRELDMRFPNMEIITATDLYFDGTREYAVVARSFATYGGS